MGCFLAATMRAPIMSIIIMFEMTLTYGAVMPLMLACTAAFNVARQLGGDSMYKNQTEQNASKTNRPFYLMLVGDIMKPDPMALPATASFPKIVATFAAHTFKHIYVVDKQNRLLGAVSLQDLKPFLTDQFVPAVVIAMDLVREIPVLADGDSLQESLVVFSTHDGERLPVVDSHKNRVLVGALSKTDVLLTMAHANKFQEQSEEAEKGKGIFN
jgi:CIC family chloride channel protein